MSVIVNMLVLSLYCSSIVQALTTCKMFQCVTKFGWGGRWCWGVVLGGGVGELESYMQALNKTNLRTRETPVLYPVL